MESGTYGFEHVLVFVTIHPWANSKWVIDQSEHALLHLLCYNWCWGQVQSPNDATQKI